jgi:hypothetical protein
MTKIKEADEGREGRNRMKDGQDINDCYFWRIKQSQHKVKHTSLSVRVPTSYVAFRFFSTSLLK